MYETKMGFVVNFEYENYNTFTQKAASSSQICGRCFLEKEKKLEKLNV